MAAVLAIDPTKYALPTAIKVDPHIGDGTDWGAWEVIDANGDHVVTRPNKYEALGVSVTMNENLGSTGPLPDGAIWTR